jgi:hypothetical protein
VTCHTPMYESTAPLKQVSPSSSLLFPTPFRSSLACLLAVVPSLQLFLSLLDALSPSLVLLASFFLALHPRRRLRLAHIAAVPVTTKRKRSPAVCHYGICLSSPATSCLGQPFPDSKSANVEEESWAFADPSYMSSESVAGATRPC